MKNKIIWAIDPTQNANDSKALVKDLLYWAKTLDCEILPVSVFDRDRLTQMLTLQNEKLITKGRTSQKQWPRNQTPQQFANQAVRNYLEAFPQLPLVPAKILFTASSSTRSQALTLARYAEKQRAVMVILETRQRKSWNPFRLGGFTETLTATTGIPVLTRNPETKTINTISKILFPTDFSADSKNALLNLTAWAKSMDAKILLFHQIEEPNLYASEMSTLALTTTINTEPLYKELHLSRTQVGQQWAQMLEKKGVASEVLLHRQRYSLPADILKAAKTYQAQMIVLSSHRGPTLQTLLGGVARDVLLQAKCPVLIFHRPKPKRNAGEARKAAVNATPDHVQDRAEIH